MSTIYRVFPKRDYFELSGVFLPSIDIYADDPDSAKRAAEKLVKRQPIGFISLIQIRGNWKAKPHI